MTIGGRKCQSRSRHAVIRGHRCVPRFSRVLSCARTCTLSCTARLHSLSTRSAPQRASQASDSFDGSIATDTSEGAECHSRSRLAVTRSPLCLSRFSRALSCSQHVYAELHNAAALSLDAHRLREALASVACDGSIATDIGGRQVPQPQACSHALTAASHASVVCSAAVSTCILSCTARLHCLCTLTASERR